MQNLSGLIFVVIIAKLTMR